MKSRSNQTKINKIETNKNKKNKKIWIKKQKIWIKKQNNVLFMFSIFSTERYLGKLEVAIM